MAKNYAILRTAKLKTMGNIAGSVAHNYRTIRTDNADPNRTQDNLHTVKTPEEVKQAIKDRLPEKRRSDAVLCIEYLMTASPDWDGWGTDKEDEFFERAGQWLIDKHGKENIAGMSVHMDETTPHLVAYVVPIDQRGKLNCKHFLGGRAKLNKMQTDFAKQVQDLGLERGREGSKAKHTTIKQYYEAINKAQQVDIEPNIPEPNGLLESKKDYAKRVAGAVIEDYKPKIATANSILSDYKYTKQDKETLLTTLAHTEQRAKPYFDAIKGLNSSEVKQIDKAIELERHRIAEIKQKSKQATLAPDNDKQADVEQNKGNFEDFYRSLPLYQQRKVAKALKAIKDTTSDPSRLQAVKDKLVNNPRLVDKLPEPDQDLDVSR